jgi:hypothetical protein
MRGCAIVAWRVVFRLRAAKALRDPCVLECNPQDQDHEKDLLRSRFIAIHEVETHPESYTPWCGPLVHAGIAR